MNDTIRPTLESTLEQVHTELDEIFGSTAQTRNIEFHPLQIEFAHQLANIFYETDLPCFEVWGVGNFENYNVPATKYAFLNSISEIKKLIIPPGLFEKYPLQFDEATLEKAPWVNLIHAWMVVLNQFNSIAKMQREGQIEPFVLAYISGVLFRFTTENPSDDPFVRSERARLIDGSYVESYVREAGTKFANSNRHVTSTEMQYILTTLKEAFSKKESNTQNETN